MGFSIAVIRALPWNDKTSKHQIWHFLSKWVSSLGIAILSTVTLIFVWSIAVVPHSPLEKHLGWSQASAFVFDDWWTSDAGRPEPNELPSYFRRYLHVPGKIIAHNKPAPSVVAAYLQRDGNERRAWEQIDLLDLSGRILRYANLRSAQFRRVRLTDAVLYRAYLQDSDLRRTDLRGAILDKADLTWAQLQGADLRGASLRQAELTWAKLHGANLDTRSEAREKPRQGAATLFGAGITGTEFHGANLAFVDFTGARGNGTLFHGAMLLSAKFHGNDLTNTEFHGAGLVAAEFYGGEITGTEFHGADITNAAFSGVTLDDVNFCGAGRADAPYRGATIEAARLTDLKICEYSGMDPTTSDTWGTPRRRALLQVNYSYLDGVRYESSSDWSQVKKNIRNGFLRRLAWKYGTAREADIEQQIQRVTKRLDSSSPERNRRGEATLSGHCVWNYGESKPLALLGNDQSCGDVYDRFAKKLCASLENWRNSREETSEGLPEDGTSLVKRWNKVEEKCKSVRDAAQRQGYRFDGAW